MGAACTPASPFGSRRLASAGSTVTETTRESSTETEMATAMSRNSCPTSSSMTRIGMKTITVVRAETKTAPQTWRAPSYAACRRV